MDYLLTIVKFTSLILAAAFAILGTTTDYKQDGKVTKWGRVAIIGVIVSGLLSSILLGLEERNKKVEKDKTDKEKLEAQNKANQEKEELYKKFAELYKNTQENIEKTQENISKTGETLKRTEEVSKDVKNSVTTLQYLAGQTQNISGGVKKNLESQSQLLAQSKGLGERQNKTIEQTQIIQTQQESVMNNTLRTLIPFKQSQLAVIYTIKYPLQAPVIQAYKKRIEEIAEETSKNSIVEYEPTTYYSPRIRIDKDRQTKKFKSIGIPSDSTLFPQNIDEEFTAASILSHQTIGMYFYKDVSTPAAAKNKDVDLFVGTLTELGERNLVTDVINYPSEARITTGTEYNKKIGRNFYKLSLEFNYEPGKEGLYVTVSTNNFDWSNFTGKILGAIDLQKSLLGVAIDESTDAQGNKLLVPNLESMTFLVGDEYDRRITLNNFKKDDEIFYNYIEETDAQVR
jgi:hypothetical protein